MSVHLANTPVLRTERLVLRAPSMEDWPAWRDFSLSRRAEFIRPDDYDEAKSWRAFGHMVGMWALRGFGSFVFCQKDEDRALGMTGPWYPIDWPEKELGWTVWSPETEGKGYAFEAAARARRYAFEDLGWDTAVSYIDPENTRSIALAERLGATPDPAAAHPGKGPVVVFRHRRGA